MIARAECSLFLHCVARMPLMLNIADVTSEESSPPSLGKRHFPIIIKCECGFAWIKVA